MLHQLKLDRSAAFNGSLYLIYGDQKTVSLVLNVKSEGHDATQEYDKYSSILPVPGLFHWRMNFMDMIHDLYTGSESAGTGSTLQHNRNVKPCGRAEVRLCHGNEIAVFEFVRFIYANTRSRARGRDPLRMLAVIYVVSILERIGENEIFHGVLREGGDFVTDFWQEVWS